MATIQREEEHTGMHERVSHTQRLFIVYMDGAWVGGGEGQEVTWEAGWVTTRGRRVKWLSTKILEQIPYIRKLAPTFITRWPWESYLAALSISFLICQQRKTVPGGWKELFHLQCLGHCFMKYPLSVIFGSRFEHLLIYLS